MAKSFYFVVSDTDKQDRPTNMEELSKRLNETNALISQPPKKEHDNNMRFVEKAFTLFKDCGLITKENVEALNDPNWCQTKFNTKMNPLGGVLRREGLKMWDTGLRYYCPYEELTQTSDRMIADTKPKQFRGASKLAVCCEGVTYYISNDWFSNDHSHPTKSAFAINLMIWTVTACNLLSPNEPDDLKSLFNLLNLPSGQQKEPVVSEETSEKTETGAVDNLTTPEATSKPDDLKVVLVSLEELHKKFDSVNKQINSINDNLNIIANKLNDKTETLSEDLTKKIENVNKEIKALYKLWE